MIPRRPTENGVPRPAPLPTSVRRGAPEPPRAASQPAVAALRDVAQKQSVALGHVDWRTLLGGLVGLSISMLILSLVQISTARASLARYKSAIRVELIGAAGLVPPTPPELAAHAAAAVAPGAGKAQEEAKKQPPPTPPPVAPVDAGQQEQDILRQISAQNVDLHARLHDLRRQQAT